MKKKLLLKLLLLVITFSFVIVNASDRLNTSEKTKVVYKGKTFYAGVDLLFNYDTDSSRQAFIGKINVDVDEKNDVFNVSINQSELNKVVTNEDTSLYFIASFVMDYHEDNVFSIMKVNEDYMLNDAPIVNENNYKNFFTIPFDVHFNDDELNMHNIFYLYEGNFFEGKTLEESFETFKAEDFQNYNLILSSDPTLNISINKDVKRDYKNVEYIHVVNFDENDQMHETKDYFEKEEETTTSNFKDKFEGSIKYIIIGLGIILVIGIVLLIIINRKNKTNTIDK